MTTAMLTRALTAQAAPLIEWHQMARIHRLFAGTHRAYALANMNDFPFALLVGLALVIGCGGHTVPDATDAGNDATGPIAQCHGYCPQPNGASCSSDCDCYNKCVGAVCADPIAPSTSCSGDAATCPSGQKCGPFGECEGATCSTTADCPIEQQCISGACVTMACI